MKDLFSCDSENYASFRPGYPPELFHFLKSHLQGYQRALDCGTGNGQVAAELAEFMECVDATDISRQQLKQARQKSNIIYSLQQAEKLHFPPKSFDLITVAQAIHWFDFSQFYAKVNQMLKPSGLIAVMGYGLIRSNPETDMVIDRLYQGILGPFWEPERKYLEEAYKTIRFPFSEIPAPRFIFTDVWSYKRLKGYLGTWSSIKKYILTTGKDPLHIVEYDLAKSFGSSGKVVFPIFIRLGRLS